LWPFLVAKKWPAAIFIWPFEWFVAKKVSKWPKKVANWPNPETKVASKSGQNDTK
jgi:hypothetical protein